MTKQIPKPSDEQELSDIVIRAAKQLGCGERKVPEEIWRGMRERQKLMRRSLRSKTRMSGPL